MEILIEAKEGIRGRRDKRGVQVASTLCPPIVCSKKEGSRMLQWGELVDLLTG